MYINERLYPASQYARGDRTPLRDAGLDAALAPFREFFDGFRDDAPPAFEVRSFDRWLTCMGTVATGGGVLAGALAAGSKAAGLYGMAFLGGFALGYCTTKEVVEAVE
jgi:hypothetical protein